jgi:hypothetical protein
MAGQLMCGQRMIEHANLFFLHFPGIFLSDFCRLFLGRDKPPRSFAGEQDIVRISSVRSS